MLGQVYRQGEYLMTQRTAIVAAVAVTAFVLVLIGGVVGVAARVAVPQAAAPVVAAASPSATSAPDPAAPAISPDWAGMIALAATPGAQLMRQPDLVLFQGAVAYEVTLDQGLVYVDANSGQVLYNGAAPAQAPGFFGGEGEQREQHEFGEGGFDN
jgi:hypothetical protein